MEFVIKNFNKNIYSGEIIFYWLERNITFKYGIEKVKQQKNDGIIKLDFHIEGKYRIAHNLKNNKTNEYDDFRINIVALGAIQIASDIKKRYEWVYFEIRKLSETDIIFETYNKDKFEEEENDMRGRLGKVKIEYWNSYWKSLHYISLIYPENPSQENKKEIKKLLEKMKLDGISCPHCKEHYILFLKKYNIDKIGESNETLFQFFFDLHNNVNEKLSKPVMSSDKVKELYNDLEKIGLELRDMYSLDIKDLFEKNRLIEFPKIHHTTGSNLIKERLNIFVLKS